MKKHFPIAALAALLLTAALVGCRGKDADSAATTAAPTDTEAVVPETVADESDPAVDTNATVAEPDTEAPPSDDETTAEDTEETTENYFEATRIDRVEPDTTKVPDMAVTGQGYDIYTLPEDVGGYRYGATYLYNEDGSVDAYFASVGALGEWDWISYRHSPDNGVTWSDEKIVLTPTQGSMDFFSCCDPGVVYFNGYYYLGYTSTISELMTCNNVFVARSQNPDGPFEKWNGSGWGGYEPAPIFYYDETYTSFGMGEPSFVELNGTLYIYYTSSSNAGAYTMVATADATDENWPATIQHHGAAVQKSTDSLDVKYVEEWGKFMAIATGEGLGSNSWLAVYESNDGLHFELKDAVREGTLSHLHNAGISSRRNGHIRLAEDADRLCVVYAYGTEWGVWNARVQPISLRLSEGNDMDAERAKACLPETMHRAEAVAKEDRPVVLVRPIQDVISYHLGKESFTLRLNQFDSYHEQSALRKGAEGVSFHVHDESVCRIDSETWRVTLTGVGTTAVEVRYHDLVFLFHIRVTAEKESEGGGSEPAELIPVRDTYTIYMGERTLRRPQLRVRMKWTNGTYTEYYVNYADVAISYTGYDDTLIAVSDRGIVNAMQVGETTVTVTCMGKSCTIKVKVSDDPEDGFYGLEGAAEMDYTHLDFSQKGTDRIFSGINNTRAFYDEAEQALRAVVSGADPILQMNYGLAFPALEAQDYKALEITYMCPTSNSASATYLQVFYCAGEITGADGRYQTRHAVITDGEYHTLTVNLSELSFWTGDIHSIRLDYFDQADVGDTMYIKSVKLIEQ